MSNEETNGSWRGIFLGLLITLVLTSFGFTWILGDSKVSKEEDKVWKDQHKDQHMLEIRSLKESQQDIKDAMKEMKEDTKQIKELLIKKGK